MYVYVCVYIYINLLLNFMDVYELSRITRSFNGSIIGEFQVSVRLRVKQN